jgi:adenosylhomocysteine nucleosidase
MPKLLIIAALEREIAPLVGDWKITPLEVRGRKLPAFEKGDSFVVCGGIGAKAARAAADAAYRHLTSTHPVGQKAADKGGATVVGLIISAGVAGALDANLKVAGIIRPTEVIDEVDGQRIRTAATGNRDGVLISASSISGERDKRDLAAAYSAQAVDMEAYAVGDVARIHGVPFLAIKAISDELDFPMPPLSRFVDSDGQFRTRSFAAYAAIRPWLWPTVIRLGRNTNAASRALCGELRQVIADCSAGLYNKG